MRDRRSSFHILYYCIIVVLLIALAVIFLAERNRNKKYRSEYEKNYGQEEKTDLEAITSDVRSSGQAGGPAEAYETLCSSLQEGLAGIVCWGDEAMAGSDAGSLPSKLSKTVNDELMKQVKKDLKDSGSFDLEKLDIPVADMGIADEGLNEFMVRTGTHQLVLGEAYNIPAKKEQKDIVLTDEEGSILRFSNKEMDKFGQVTIETVKGQFCKGSYSYDKNHSNLAFVRDVKGKEKEILVGTDIHTQGAELYQDYVPVLFFSEKGESEIGQWIEGIREMISSNNSEEYVIILAAGKDSNWDKKFSKAFKNHYLRCEKAPGDMMKEDYQTLADKVYRKLKKQGTFDKVTAAVDDARDSLKID